MCSARTLARERTWHSVAMPLDIGIGILLALGVHEHFGALLTPVLVLFGIAATLLPDIDIFTMAFGEWKHRGITHRPIVYLPLCFLAFVFLPLPYAVLLALGIYAHFIHDTIGIGWGIAWLWPFSGRKFLVFPDRARRKVLGAFVTWLPDEEQRIRTQPYSGAGTHWVRDFYFRPTALSYIEYGMLLIALVTLATYIW